MDGELHVGRPINMYYPKETADISVPGIMQDVNININVN